MSLENISQAIPFILVLVLNFNSYKGKNLKKMIIESFKLNKKNKIIKIIFNILKLLLHF
jgi:hypothetical protein